MRHRLLVVAQARPRLLWTPFPGGGHAVPGGVLRPAVCRGSIRHPRSKWLEGALEAPDSVSVLDEVPTGFQAHLRHQSLETCVDAVVI